ncbi:hypothetical protein DVH24_011617 [Malus domestica]|uniref:Uncharacterized protein n=1 Tax=Malus domestica TaxID=3750 RepID=A0A498K0N6_MALDO|nr:hypothetical protein DVH24_011617 [Malus domestica]
MAWASDRLILYCPRSCCDCAKGLTPYWRAGTVDPAENSRNSKGFLRRRGMLAVLMLSVLLALVLMVALTCWRIRKQRKTKGKK